MSYISKYNSSLVISYRSNKASAIVK